MNNNYFYSTCYDEDVKVEYTFTPGYPATREDPGTDPELEITAIIPLNGSTPLDFDLISEDEYNRLVEEGEEDVDLMYDLWVSWFEDENGFHPDDPRVGMDTCELSKRELQDLAADLGTDLSASITPVINLKEPHNGTFSSLSKR